MVTESPGRFIIYIILMPSIVREVLRCLLHVFYKIHVNCNCSKCCQSDCILETENIEHNNESHNESNNKNIKEHISSV